MDCYYIMSVNIDINKEQAMLIGAKREPKKAYTRVRQLKPKKPKDVSTQTEPKLKLPLSMVINFD